MVGFLLVAAIIAVLLIVLQSDSSALAIPLFLLLLAGAVTLAISNAPPRVRRIILTPKLAAKVVADRVDIVKSYVSPVLARFRPYIAIATGVNALVWMALSTQQFQIYRTYRWPLDKPVFCMIVGALSVGVSLYLSRPNIALPLLARTRAHALTRINFWAAGTGVAVLLFLSELNGRATGALRLYPIVTDAQFWMLVLGISLAIMGLVGWRPIFRFPAIKWRFLLIGIVLVVASELFAEIITFGVFQQWANQIIHAVLFVTVRIGDLLILFGLCAGLFKRPTLNRRAWIAIAAFVGLLLIFSQPENLNLATFNFQENLTGVILWLVLFGLSAAAWWFKLATRGTILLGLGTIIAAYFSASLSGTIVIDLLFVVAINVHFWGFITLANLLRLPITALYRSVQPKPEPAVETLPVSEPETVESSVPQHSVPSTQNFFSRIPHSAYLIPILFIAIFARFYLLNDTMRFLIDEDSFIGATHYLRAVPNMELLSPFSSIAAFPYLYPFGQMHTIDILGRSFGGLRGFSAIMGVFGIAAIYFLGRTIFDRKTALVAALLLAVFPPHIHFSRIAISEIASPFFGTLAFAFLGRAMLHNRRADYVLGAAMLGMTHYFHEGGRLLYTPVAIAWIIACLLLTARRKTDEVVVGTRHVVSNLIIALVTLIIVAAPVYYTLIAMDRPVFARMVNNNSGLSGAYWQSLSNPVNLDMHIHNHLLPAFQVYVNQVDNTLFYADTNALVLPLILPFFLLGVFYALWRWRAPGTGLLLGWILASSLGNSLMVDSAGSPRYVMVFPALVLTIALGVRYGIPLIVPNRRRASVVIAVLAIGFALFQANHYFNIFLPHYNMSFRAVKANPDGYDAALRSVNFPAGTNIHIISQNLFTQIEGAGLMGFMRSNLYLDTITPADFSDEYLAELHCRVDHAFFIERTDFDTLNKLRANFFLRDPQFTPYADMLPSHSLLLFYAPYIKGSEKVYGRKC
jgi:4-amino-4-deoxy-L-arabinose transferase-like glycosyltransferase